jgi:hypothetical protein
MKLLVIWDLHWLNIWKKLIKKHNPDKVIFLWDYVDSFTIPDMDMINNLEDIIEYKKDNIDSTVLLLGNHDISYIYEWNGCSWNRISIKPLLENIYKKNLDLFKIVHTEWNYIFSHAWITEGWISKNIKILNKYKNYEDILKSKDRNILFQSWKSRGWIFRFWW